MAGRYQAYPEYKNSGVRFFDYIPQHWAISKVRFISSFGRGLGITKANLKDTGVPCVSYGEVHSKYGFEVDPTKHNLKCVDEEYLRTSPDSLLSKGDFVFADTSEDIDGSGNFTQLVSDETLFAGYHTVVVRPTSDNYYRFLAYVFDSPEYRTQVRDAVKGVKVFSVTQAILKNTNVWLPTYEEQQKIAKFLDYETAKIDTLISKQEKLIELLKEKRQAVISHVVTRGLNPDVPMKDSGVEWLGDVPEHWLHTSLKHYSNVIDCKHITAEFFDNGIPLASIGEVKSWFVNLKNAKLTNEKYYNDLIGGGRTPQVGDIIYSRNATVGEAAIVADDLPLFALGQDVCLLRQSKKISSVYLMFVLHSGVISQQLELAMVGSTFKRINVENIKSFLIAVPPFEEQEMIVKELEKKLAQYDSLISNAVNAIELMKERKVALISSAVTGKIDVRSWQAPVIKEEEVA
jgi:type I restriction enzyme S subunit